MYRMPYPGRMSGPPGRPPQNQPQPPKPAPPCCCPMPPVSDCPANPCCPLPPVCRPPVVCRLTDLPLAMAYVPMQVWSTPYPPEKALCRGTMFPPLDLPLGGQG